MRKLLLPLTAIYALVMMVRNKLYDWGVLRSQTFEREVICVGNITVGGTGKTPFIEHLLRMLAERKPAVVSRGYGRKTRGLVVASETSTAAEIGDEPSQIKKKFARVPVVVAEDRNAAIRWVLGNTDSEVVLMDDGFQHRSTRASKYILIADYARPMWSDWTFPAGNMREPWSGRHRADMIVVNKCPADLGEAERDAILRKLDVRCPVYFSSIAYGGLVPVAVKGKGEGLRNVVGVAGIGRPEPFFEELKRRYDKVVALRFADHHRFSDGDVKRIVDAARANDAFVVCTEKDAKRLPALGDVEVYYLPIELNILFDQKISLCKTS